MGKNDHAKYIGPPFCTVETEKNKLVKFFKNLIGSKIISNLASPSSLGHNCVTFKIKNELDTRQL
jgi:hypothetical protein